MSLFSFEVNLSLYVTAFLFLFLFVFLIFACVFRWSSTTLMMNNSALR